METNKNEQSGQNEPKRLSVNEEILLRLKQDKKTSRRIAEMYALKNPREVSYGVLMLADNDAKKTFYFSFNEEEKAKMNEYLNRPEEDMDIPLWEFLGDEMEDKFLIEGLGHTYDTPLDVDLNDTLKFNYFTVQFLQKDGILGWKEGVEIALTDEQYLDVLTELIFAKNELSANQLVCLCPDVAQIIMGNVVNNLSFRNCNTRPFICDMYEMKLQVQSMLNPFEDSLGLFKSEDEELKRFLDRHRIVPDYEELYTEEREEGTYRSLAYVAGSSCHIHQDLLVDNKEWIPFFKVGIPQDHFEFDLRKIKYKLGLEEYEEIIPYLKEHFSQADCLSKIREAFS